LAAKNSKISEVGVVVIYSDNNKGHRLLSLAVEILVSWHDSDFICSGYYLEGGLG
jgi:hypothetical protein